MKAVIMAGGKGTRLRPLTCSMPKPMVPVVNRPMMEHVIHLLVAHDFTELACTLCYMPEAIQGYFGDGSSMGCKITYSVEDTPLGTAGSVRALGDFLDGTFLVISGDALTDIDLASAVAFHRKKGAAATIVLTRVATPLEYGVVIVDNDGRITRFLEKPSWGEVFSDTVNTGIYVLEPEIMKNVNPSCEFDFSKNLFPMLLSEGYPMYGYIADGYWCDVGNLDQYRKTSQDILEGKVAVKIPGDLVDDGIWVSEGAEIGNMAALRPPVVVGAGARIEAGALVGEYSVVGPSCIIAEGASVRRSILSTGCFIGSGAEAHGAILGSRVSAKAGVSIQEGAVVGSGCSIGERAQVRPGVKIWPDKTVDGGAQISTSLVWGASWSKRLFGRLGVTGLANIEVTPDFAARLGAAYGSCFSGGTVAVSSDIHPVSDMIKRALTSGILSSGMSVAELDPGTTAVARYAVPALGADGGVHVRVSPTDRNSTLLEFLDSSGINVDKGTERRIENAFLTEDFKRANPEKAGKAIATRGTVGRYLDAITSSVDVDTVRGRGMKVVAGYDRAYIGELMRAFCDACGCDLHHVEIANSAWAPSAVTDTVAMTRADLGFLLDRNAERLLLVDETGSSISNEEMLALICVSLLTSHRGATVAVPVTASSSIERLAAAFRGHVVRTQANPRSMMEKAIEARVRMGEANLPHFQPVLDGVFALAVIFEYLAREGSTLSAFAQMAPRSYMAKQIVDCPWEDKGRVMRRLIEETDGEDVQLIDGIKVYDDHGWTLILPDSEEPLFHVYSEAQSQEIAEEIAGIYVSRIAETISDTQMTGGARNM